MDSSEQEDQALVIPLPHPSWRNTGWIKKNPWFEKDLLPELRKMIQSNLD